MKTYTTETPKRAGMYWYLEQADSSPKIVRIFKDSDGHWSVQYDTLQIAAEANYDDEGIEEAGIDYLQNWSRPGSKGYWCRIQPPQKPVPDDMIVLDNL